MDYLWILISTFITAFFSWVSMRHFDGAKKIDKGFAFIYWKLSYRRKFIRTLWMSPVIVITILGLQLVCDSSLFIRVIEIALVLSFVIQAIYNYIKWRTKEL